MPAGVRLLTKWVKWAMCNNREGDIILQCWRWGMGVAVVGTGEWTGECLLCLSNHYSAFCCSGRMKALCGQICHCSKEIRIPDFYSLTTSNVDIKDINFTIKRIKDKPPALVTNSMLKYLPSSVQMCAIHFEMHQIIRQIGGCTDT